MEQENKKTLLVAATLEEAAPLLPAEHANISNGALVGISGTGADLLITGAGIVSTLYFTQLFLLRKRYSTAINIGVAGAYPGRFERGDVLLVSQDRFSDNGSESPEGFVPGEHLSFTPLNSFPYQSGWLFPVAPSEIEIPGLPSCKGITSDTIHTDPATVEKLTQLYQPDIETMEGAAFFYVCLQMDIPCMQIRAISNRVGPRTPGNWQLKTAIQNLTEVIQKLNF
jgi:futalosine hydrolase